MDMSKMIRRQLTSDDTGTDNLNDGYWWYSSTAYAIKWAVIAAILVALFLFFVGGYLHARKRMQKGFPPLSYHRWLVPSKQRIAFAQRYPQHAHHFFQYRNTQAPYGHGQAYPLGAYVPPPPAYHEPDYVPAYTPQGPNKIDPDQNYAPPSGPPPPHNGAAPSFTGGPSQPPRAAHPYGS